MKSSPPWLRCLVFVACACEGKTVTLGHAARHTVSVEPPLVDASGAEPPADASGADTSRLDASPASTPSSGAEDSAVAEQFEVPRFGEAVLVAGIASDLKDDNPTLTADLRQIFFTSTRSGNADVWTATRPEPSATFGAPQVVSIVNTSEFDSSPAIDADGLTLWVGSQREGGLGGLDVWFSERADLLAEWSAPKLVPELSSSDDDIPRPLGNGATAMPLGSRRRGDDVYLTYLAERSSPGAAFGEPRLLEELVVEGFNTIDGFLSLDGGQLLFVHTAEERGDLFIAWRQGRGFVSPLSIDSVNTDADERDPWLSPDGDTLFFASDRAGSLQIYQASRLP